MSYGRTLLFKRVLETLDENSAISLKRVAERLRVSKRTLEICIKVNGGGTFRELRQSLFVAKTRDLLNSQPTLTVKELSVLVGFSSPHSFARAIRNATGLSPKELRAQIAHKAPALPAVGDARPLPQKASA